MRAGILQPDVEKRGVVLDPRTKLLLLLTLSIFVLGGAGGNVLDDFMPFFCAAPFVLHLLAKRWKSAFLYLIVYSAAWAGAVYLLPHTTGLVNFLLVATCGILSRFLPCILMGAYLIETTTVSEFMAAMHRMHVTDKIAIPLSVMFRFFPTVADEFASINAAMRMRGIQFGGKQAAKMVEYRLVPLMVCTAKIGEELNAAALTRGLGGEVRRTNICQIGFRLPDICFMLLCLVPYVVWIGSMIGLLQGVTG